MIDTETKEKGRDMGQLGCAGCTGCPLGRLIAKGKLTANVDPVRFQAALARRRLMGGCGTTQGSSTVG